MVRNLDGVFFRIKRGDVWYNLCWTDLTPEEREQVSTDRPLEWWKGMTEILTNTIIDIGNQLDLFVRLPQLEETEESPAPVEPEVVE